MAKLIIPHNFKKYCPYWYEKIKEDKNLTKFMQPSIIGGHGLDISWPAACIVGEKWGFNFIYSNSSYLNECQVCNNLGIDFMNDIESKDVNSLNKDLKKFCDHCDKVHERR